MKSKINIDIYIARVAAIGLLTATGVSALGGGAALVVDPTGALLGFDQSGLSGTYFTDFRLPGLMLLVLIGVFNLLVAGLTVNKVKFHATLIFLQGCILTGWVLVQVYLLPVTHLLQLVFGFAGLMLMMLGSLLGSRRAL